MCVCVCAFLFLSYVSITPRAHIRTDCRGRGISDDGHLTFQVQWISLIRLGVSLIRSNAFCIQVLGLVKLS